MFVNVWASAEANFSAWMAGPTNLCPGMPGYARVCPRYARDREMDK